MSRLPVRIVIMALAVIIPSCRTLTHQKAKEQAQQRWSAVRGRVKTQLARQQFEGQLFKDAAATLVESLAIDPAQSEAYVLLARANLELGKIASAREAVSAAHDAGIDSAELVYTDGVILEQSDDLQAALECYRRAWALNPDNVDYLIAFSESLVALDRSDEALGMLSNNVDRLDNDGTLRVLIAHVAVLNGDVELAIAQLRRAMTATDAEGMVAEKLGVLLARTDRCGEAQSMLQPFLAQDRLSGERGSFVVRSPRQPPTIEDSTDTAQVHGALRRALAACFLETGDAGQARRILLDYAEEHPEDAPANLLLAKAALAMGDLAIALSSINAAESRDPAHTEVKLVRAALQWKTGDLGAAVGTLEALLARVPDDVEAHCLLAEVLVAQCRAEAARAEYRYALELDPTCQWAAAGLESLARSAGDS